ncbi:type IV secretion protein Rhs [Pseudoalteromonas luteoviolacea]|uniref:Type IV secretion protein Rhs n=1 Tax=Pseudoalteromonas luteoviolacea TaxID=43657 RepID=A0A023Q190_9GAMM|nr:type VI secretion system tip protein VgrG [Pseudoalteromonas luteoviolacea]AHX39912.1 hypothetical protein [Pseudoalteromonas luteoviolacea]KID56057.1 type IV secretion protein Rhs [Pseudoalteromonas luteoviolacea]
MFGLDAGKLTGADESHFGVTIAGLSDALFQVQSFQADLDALCDDCIFDIQVLSEELVEPDVLIGKDISLIIAWSTEDLTVTGLLTNYICHGQSHQGFVYTLTLQSGLAKLKQHRSNRIFTDMTPGQIIQSVLQKCDFPSAQLDLQVSGPTLDMVVQYDESDYDFITRLMRRYGYVYGWRETDYGIAKLAICESSDKFARPLKEITLPFVSPSGQVRTCESVFAFSKKATMLSEQVRYYDSHYERGAQIQGSSRNNTDISGFGESAHFGDNLASDGDGNDLAEVHQRSLDCQRETLIADTDCRALRPGVCLTVTDHPSYSGEYLVTHVSHQGCQAGSVAYGSKVTGLTYKNQAVLLPIAQDYCAQPRPKRRVFATFNATIEQEVDETGQYQVKLPFNQDGEGQQSRPTRLTQTYGGQGHGMHFPLTQGTEVLVCGENGDLDRPVILGALYNAQAPSPVSSNNPYENKIVTRAGNTLVMSDKEGERKIKVATASDDNSLLLDATDGQEKVMLQSSRGEMRLQAQEDLTMQAGGNLNVTASDELTVKAADRIAIQSTDAELELHGARGIRLTADLNFKIQATDGDIDLEATQALSMEAAQEINVHSQEGNIEMSANAGEITLSSGNNLTLSTQGQGSIQLVQGRGSIEIDGAGNITINGTNLTLSARNISISGNALANN